MLLFAAHPAAAIRRWNAPPVLAVEQVRVGRLSGRTQEGGRVLPVEQVGVGRLSGRTQEGGRVLPVEQVGVELGHLRGSDGRAPTTNPARRASTRRIVILVRAGGTDGGP